MSKDEERIEVMAKHYLIMGIFADCADGTRPRATKQAFEQAKIDCLAFCQACGPELLREVQRCTGYGSHPDCGNEYPMFAAMGHDLWLTRNGHGAGFWDRAELGDFGDKLTVIAKKMGAVNYEFYRGWLYL